MTTFHCRTNREHIPVSILPWPFSFQTPKSPPNAYRPGQQTMAHGPNPIHCLSLQTKFY